MEHITEIQLIEYVAGNLTKESASNLDDHINLCPQCANTLDDISQTWQTANSWQPDIETADTSQQFAEKVFARDKKLRTYSFRTKIFQATFRYAASILIAVALGAMLGKQSVTQDSASLLDQNKPEYLATLSMQWSSDLTWTILEQDHPLVEEQGQ